jgi:photosystem II stability/assembly factor-like uncharacterized protein
VIRAAGRAFAIALLTVSVAPSAYAHDASTYGGLFRSRNLGGTWLYADVGLFLNAALTVAVDPRDPNHLLMGTDIGLYSSSNGGRSWLPEAQGLIFGAVFAIAFSPDGGGVICTAPTGIFRFRDGHWTRAVAPDGAAPGRDIAFGSAPDHIYLLGKTDLFISKDDGQSYRRLRDGPTDDAPIAALAVATKPRELLLAVIGGKLMASEDGGHEWQKRNAGSSGDPVDTIVLDPALPNRLWAASADRIFISDDLGVRWHPVGRSLPEAGTNVRGIAADETATTLVVTTHRGMYRSDDGGQKWILKENNLPAHLEAGPLIRDQREAQTLYAVYSLLPYTEVWRSALEGSNLLSRLDPVSLGGGFAFMLLLIIGGVLLVGWLERQRSGGVSNRRSLS